jgi:WD40 repeat protein
LIISGGLDKNLKIWDYEKGECIRTIKAYDEGVVSVLSIKNTDLIVSNSS